MHAIHNTWTLYAHLPHVTDWSLKSYIKVMTINSIEEIIALYDLLSPKLISSCMLFLMKNDIKPLWEDPANKLGGSFSYKVSNQFVPHAWKELSYMVCGSTLMKNYDSINGITISPKKNFCIIKIWLDTCKLTDPTLITYPKNLQAKGCIFKKHLTT
jgi:translation initiation factor 4E